MSETEVSFDHIIVHIDRDDDGAVLDRFKRDLAALGVPFEPSWGKGTKGFKVANVWIGPQYFEIVRLLQPDGGGWEPRWVERHARGHRGAFCLFFKTPDLEATARRLASLGLGNGQPEHIEFKMLFGLIRKRMPWRVLYLPPLPGTNLEIGFIGYDGNTMDKMKKFMVPNADENGIEGISELSLALPMSTDAQKMIRAIFPKAVLDDAGIRLDLSDGGSATFHDAPEVSVQLVADAKDAPNAMDFGGAKDSRVAMAAVATDARLENVRLVVR